MFEVIGLAGALIVLFIALEALLPKDK